VSKIVKAASQWHSLFLRVCIFRLAFQNLGCPQSGRFPCLFDTPDWLGRVNMVSLRAEFVPARAVPLCREHVMLRLALWEVGCPKAEGGQCPLTEWNHTACSRCRLVFAPFQAAVLKVYTAPLQGPNHAVPRPCLNRQGGHITRPELLKYLSETESHNGFANRLLWVCVKRSKFLPEGGMVPLETLTGLSMRIADALEWAKQEREFRRNDEARKLWAAVYPKLSEGQPGLLGAATSRAEAQTLRLSAVYAALDCSSIISIDHLRAALAVWDYTFASARYIFGDATGDAVADRIREALQGAGAEGLTRTQIRDLLGKHASTDRIAQALTQLAALGIASRRTVNTLGRSIELWTATEATKATEG
jgi:hypothetical protein